MAAALPLCEQADQARANGDEAGEWNFLKSGNSDQDVECLWRRSRIFFERAERKQDPEKNLEKGKDECQKALDLDAKHGMANLMMARITGRLVDHRFWPASKRKEVEKFTECAIQACDGLPNEHEPRYLLARWYYSLAASWPIRKLMGNDETALQLAYLAWKYIKNVVCLPIDESGEPGEPKFPAGFQDIRCNHIAAQIRQIIETEPDEPDAKKLCGDSDEDDGKFQDPQTATAYYTKVANMEATNEKESVYVGDARKNAPEWNAAAKKAAAV